MNSTIIGDSTTGIKLNCIYCSTNNSNKMLLGNTTNFRFGFYFHLIFLQRVHVLRKKFAHSREKERMLLHKKFIYLWVDEKRETENLLLLNSRAIEEQEKIV